MPRLVESTRQERRMRIASAALRCFARDGIANTSMADVTRESGLSTGSIYSHFESKADLLRFAVSRALEERFASILEEGGVTSRRTTPEDLLSLLLRTSAVDADQARMLLQIWSEVAQSPDLAAVAGENIAKLQFALTTLLRPWAEHQVTDQQRASGLADDISSALSTVMIGYAVRLALDPQANPTYLRASLTAAFAANNFAPIAGIHPGGPR